MNHKAITRFLTLSCIGSGAYFVGHYVGKNQYAKELSLHCDNHFDKYLRNKEELSRCTPPIPFIGTVSASTITVLPEGKQVTSSNPKRVSEILKYGIPGMDNIRSHSDYVLSYDNRNKVAHWVYEHLTAESVKKNDSVDRVKCEFKVDDSIHAYFRSTNLDYRNSGYDRGHLAAAGNHKVVQKHMDDTFFLSNMAPQVGKGFNRDSWNRLESHVRKLARKHKNVYVVTGPLYLPQSEANGKRYVKYEVIGNNSVAVPTHFFKVIVIELATEDGFELQTYVMPNKAIDDGTSLSVFLVPLDFVERSSGLLFFKQIPVDKLKKINLRRLKSK